MLSGRVPSSCLVESIVITSFIFLSYSFIIIPSSSFIACFSLETSQQNICCHRPALTASRHVLQVLQVLLPPACQIPI